MSRARLQARLGAVEDRGRAVLHDWRHRFSKRGGDGTGKGNIEPVTGSVVHGVLYVLTRSQLDRLVTFEGGYALAELPVHRRGIGELAATFVARPPVAPLRPAPFYVAHYVVGMREHGIPSRYAEEILGGARGC